MRTLSGVEAAPSTAEWHEALHEFASCAAQLEGLLREHQPAGAPGAPGASTTSEACQAGIKQLEAELQAKETLLQRAHEQVRKWARVCDELKHTHESNLYKGIS
ncbi:hypothetical protein FOA52_000041 [Chlamydomonas sp. UWO 241]|nr:hypothetical protein FOA52_000041 [Chlamydomonas sp. UWO 241]